MVAQISTESVCGPYASFCFEFVHPHLKRHVLVIIRLRVWKWRYLTGVLPNLRT